MLNLSFKNLAALVTLRTTIAKTFPTVLLTGTAAEPEIGVSTFNMVLRNEMALCVSNDPDVPGRFLVMRAAGGPEQALPFETGYEDGCGVIGAVTIPQVLEAICDYAAVGETAAAAARMGPDAAANLH